MKLAFSTMSKGAIAPLLASRNIWALCEKMAGAVLCPIKQNAKPLFRIAGYCWLPGESQNYPSAVTEVTSEDGSSCESQSKLAETSLMRNVPLLESLTDLPSQTLDMELRKDSFSIAGITLSDKGACGQRQDLSGQTLREMMAKAFPDAFYSQFILPDDSEAITALLADLALHQGYDLILTTGGTGVSPRDNTPQATARLIDVPLPGFTQAMMHASLSKTPYAMISRAVAGLIGSCLVINLPGSQRAVRENLEAILPALPHSLAKIHGDSNDCGS